MNYYDVKLEIWELKKKNEKHISSRHCDDNCFCYKKYEGKCNWRKFENKCWLVAHCRQSKYSQLVCSMLTGN